MTKNVVLNPGYASFYIVGRRINIKFHGKFNKKILFVAQINKNVIIHVKYFNCTLLHYYSKKHSFLEKAALLLSEKFGEKV